MNQNKIDLANVPKHFCQGVLIASTNDAFFAMVDTGGNKITYAFTPEHMKQLYQSIGYHIGEFEKKSRKIEANWSPGIESPIQSNDLKDKGGESKKNSEID
jgi:hypothetical protein